MESRQKKNRPVAGTTKRLSVQGLASENDCGIMVPHAALAVKPSGVFRDPLGRWPAMPVYNMPEETPEVWNAKAARLERREMLRAFWNAETDDPETLEWREDLTPEEDAMVAAWDHQYGGGILRLCEDILRRGDGNAG